MKTAMLLLALAFGFTACSASTDELLPTQDDNSIGNSHTYNSLISKTTAYPASYAEEVEHKGRVERIDYATRDYAEGTGRSRTNTAYVYLPYGYDDTTIVGAQSPFSIMWSSTLRCNPPSASNVVEAVP